MLLGPAEGNQLPIPKMHGEPQPASPRRNVEALGALGPKECRADGEPFSARGSRLLSPGESFRVNWRS